MAAAFPYMTTVNTVAASKDLTVKATVFAEMGHTPTVPEQAQMDVTIHQASALMVGYVRREFAQEKVTDKFARPDWCWPDYGTLRLSRVPVVTIHSVIVDGVTLGNTEYEVNPQTGELWRLDSSGYRAGWSPWTVPPLSVQHTSGYILLTDLPHDVEAACIAQCKAMFQSRLRDPTKRSESVPGVYDVSYSVPGGDSFGKSGLLKSVEAALAIYRSFVMA